MTKKDYILLAKALASVHAGNDDQESMWENCVGAVGQALAQDNPNFNPSTFALACLGEKK
jgi:hypothetical protein